ncbi:MAG: hypothetical protein GKR97_20325 [Rhizobiaceae bacterium]|nr:hypothetical protein [Rhizobiaceae bacterium]
MCRSKASDDLNSELSRDRGLTTTVMTVRADTRIAEVIVESLLEERPESSL